MPIWATGALSSASVKVLQLVRYTRSRRSATGFSLIELLIAVFVIVLLTSVVSLNVGRGGSSIALKEDAKHLLALMNYMQSEAEMAGVDHGLYLEQKLGDGILKTTGYWLRRYDQGWAEPRGSSELLAPFVFHDNTVLWLTLEDNPNIEIGERDPELRPSPQVVFFASGEVTEGHLDWMTQDTRELLFSIHWGFFGDFTLLPAGQKLDDYQP